MTAAQRRPDEKTRLESVDALDLEAARPTFERISMLARSLAGVRSAHVDLVHAKALWITGAGSRPAAPVARDESFANHVIAGDEVLWVEDLRKDARFRANPYVTGPAQCRFYAGAPIRLSNGSRIGALSIIDSRPRPYDAFLAERLEDLAMLAADEWERRRALAESARATAEARLLGEQMTALVEAAPVALVMTDRELRVLRVSPRWRRDMGMEGVEVVGRRLYELFPQSEARLGESFMRALAGEVVAHERLEMQPRKGVRVWARAEATPWRDPVGSIGGLLIMTHDITDIVESLERAERSEQRFRLAAEMAELSVYDLDIRGERLDTDGADVGDMTDQLTYEAMDNIWQAVHPADRELAKARWDLHEREGGYYRSVHRILQKDGPHLWISVVAEAKLGEDGRPERVVGVIRNIDGEKRAEAALVKALDAAEAANRAKSEFLANMSHEIRTPLNGVTGIASVLGRTPLNAAQREMVGVIEASARTLETLLSDVLDLARIESGKVELADEPFDLAAALRTTAALFEPRALEKGLRFKTTISPAAQARVRGDVTRLRQILSNLLSNAVKFTEQGRVSLNVEAEPVGETVRLRLSVIDTGIGFDAETEKRLFQRFEQADGSITRRFGGTGLGLAISRSLAEAMGGALSANATPGKGAVFTLEVELPIAVALETVEAGPAAKVEAVEDAPAEVQAGRPPRILLAEDHPTNRKVVSLILESAGVDLVCVENGAEALAAAEASEFDLILMDMQMPVMDGLTAIRAIRVHEGQRAGARTPILSLTANAMPEHALASIEAGADGHLTKPISAVELIAAVANACETSPEPVLAAQSG
jgi:PAS domain S-box-containing protein